MNFNKLLLTTLFFLFTLALSAQNDFNKNEYEFNAIIQEFHSLDIANQSQDENERYKNLSGLSSFEDDLLIARRNDIYESDAFQFLDSLEYQHDENKNLISVNTLRWDGINWNNAIRTILDYDENGNRILLLGQQFLNGEWINTNEFTYEYDDQNNETLRRIRTWFNEVWNDVIQTIRIYDQNNQLLEKINQRSESGIWTNIDKDLYHYSGNGNISEIDALFWFDNQWFPSDLTTYLYDSNGNLVEQETRKWTTGILEPQYLIIYEYDDLKNRIASISQEAIDGIYINLTKTSFSFDNQNLLSCSNQFIWENNNWLDFRSVDYNYDDRENRLYNIVKEWSSTNSDWENISQSFYYYLFSSSTNEFTSENISFNISPNPNNGIFDLNINDQLLDKIQIKIYTSEGKLMDQFIVNERTRTSSVNLSHLAHGNYILNVTSDQGTGSQKIIIVR